MDKITRIGVDLAKNIIRVMVDRYPFCGRHELAFKSYPRPVGGSPVTTTTSAGGG